MIYVNFDGSKIANATGDPKIDDIGTAIAMLSDIQRAESGEFPGYGVSPDDGFGSAMRMAIASVIAGCDLGVAWEAVTDTLEARANTAATEIRLAVGIGLHPESDAYRAAADRGYRFRIWGAQLVQLMMHVDDATDPTVSAVQGSEI